MELNAPAPRRAGRRRRGGGVLACSSSTGRCTWLAGTGATSASRRLSAWQAFASSTSCSPRRAGRDRPRGRPGDTAQPALPVAASVITRRRRPRHAARALYRLIDQPGPDGIVDVELRRWLGLAPRAGDRLRRLALDARRAVRRRAGTACPACSTDGAAAGAPRSRASAATPPTGHRGRGVAGLASTPMLDRDQVLHVARLARLELTDEEVETMAGELSTSSTTSRRSASSTSRTCADLARRRGREVLRADEPRPSLPASGPASRARRRGRRVPRPQPGRRRDA